MTRKNYLVPISFSDWLSEHGIQQQAAQKSPHAPPSIPFALRTSPRWIHPKTIPIFKIMVIDVTNNSLIGVIDCDQLTN